MPFSREKAADFGAGEQIVQVLHRAGAEDRRCYAGVSHHKGHRHVRQRHPGPLRDGDEVFDRFQIALVGHLPGKHLDTQAFRQCLALAVAAGEHALR